MVRFFTTVAACVVVACAAPAAAEEIKGQAIIAGVPSIIALDIDDDLATLRHRPANNSAGWSRYVVHGPRQALALLADERLAFLWPALERMGGDDMSKLRDQSLERTRRGWQEGRLTAPNDEMANVGLSRRARALGQYVDALMDAGQWEAALELLTSERKRERGTSTLDHLELQAIIRDTAQVLEGLKQTERELDVWRQGIQLLGDSPFSLNLRLSLAARLAETGHYAESLEISEAARATFLKTAPANQVPNALPQFDWIRACALKGMGRADEASAIMAGVADAEQVESRRIHLPRIRDHEQRAYQCLRDPQGLADVWSRDLRQGPAIGSETFLLAQASAETDVLHRPTVDAAHAMFTAAPPLRMLPDRYSAAQRAWR